MYARVEICHPDAMHRGYARPELDTTLVCLMVEEDRAQAMLAALRMQKRAVCFKP